MNERISKMEVADLYRRKLLAEKHADHLLAESCRLDTKAKETMAEPDIAEATDADIEWHRASKDARDAGDVYAKASRRYANQSPQEPTLGQAQTAFAADVGIPPEKLVKVVEAHAAAIEEPERFDEATGPCDGKGD